MSHVHTYIVEHDFGFAPNPFHGVCTLACCKPVIRKHASIGDFIVGTASAKTGLAGHLAYWMRVDEILSFDAYWRDPRFQSKKPNLGGSRMLCFGDNIYHRENDEGEFIQAQSFHSDPDGKNLKVDTGHTDRVMIGREFAFWGGSGPKVPNSFSDFVHTGVGHKKHFPEDRKQDFIAWLTSLPERGQVSEPAHWPLL